MDDLPVEGSKKIFTRLNEHSVFINFANGVNQIIPDNYLILYARIRLELLCFIVERVLHDESVTSSVPGLIDPIWLRGIEFVSIFFVYFARKYDLTTLNKGAYVTASDKFNRSVYVLHINWLEMAKSPIVEDEHLLISEEQKLLELSQLEAVSEVCGITERRCWLSRFCLLVAHFYKLTGMIIRRNCEHNGNSGFDFFVLKGRIELDGNFSCFVMLFEYVYLVILFERSDFPVEHEWDEVLWFMTNDV